MVRVLHETKSGDWYSDPVYAVERGEVLTGKVAYENYTPDEEKPSQATLNFFNRQKAIRREAARNMAE